MDLPSPTRQGGPPAKVLWALFWRMLVLGPLVSLVGGVALVVAILADVGLLLGAVVLAAIGEYMWTLIAAGGWVGWRRFGRPVREWIFEGFDHGSL
ncbi:MAG TPA: hypothetical protein VNO52_04645 [Methylomirabilota bacterium]|nr:hypothetical protein [Methylomirabilota bacterium]